MLDNELLSPVLTVLGNLNSHLLKGRLRSSAGDMKRLVRAVRTRGIPPFGLFNIGMDQIELEIVELAKIVGVRRPSSVCEIGTRQGGTLLLWCALAKPDAKIVSIDKPGGPFGGGYRKYRTNYYRSFAYANQELLLLRCDSHAPETFRRVQEFLANGKLDFLFIDGDHTYEGVKADFETYSRLVRPDGLIVFHDIAPTTNLMVGVPRFWQKITETHRTQQIIADENQSGAGIGIIVGLGNSHSDVTGIRQ